MTPPSGTDAGELRRRLGPAGWCAYECVCDAGAGTGLAKLTVRALAAELGVAKNTAHRALRGLVAAGLIEPVQERGEDGRFRPGGYRLLSATAAAPRRPLAAARRPKALPADADVPLQLSLLPD